MDYTTGLAPCPLNISAASYSCANPYPNCTNPAGFQFASLWLITEAIATCADDQRLYEGLPMLTQASCHLFTHRKAWTAYPPADIWARLTTWKFPLLQLIAVFPRPPLTLLAELFVLVHLLGDPISTVKDLLLKVASCQARAEFWKEKFDGGEMRHLTEPLNDVNHPEGTAGGVQRQTIQGMWKALTAIVDSYDEWGSEVGTAVEVFVFDRLTNTDVDEEGVRKVTDEDQRQFLELCRVTANALAADRSTKFLPIIVAQCFFIGTIAIAFGRTKDSAAAPNPPTFINIEAHSIAFSSLYFWIIPAVIISSIIGASQTEDAIPRILRRFNSEVHRDFPEWERLPSENLTTELRERSGGLYSWQPKESRIAVTAMIQKHESSQPRWPAPSYGFWRRLRWLVVQCLNLRPGSATLPVFIFTYGALTGMLISYLVPPVGFDCRHVGEIAIALTWILSACLNNLPLFPNIHSSDEALATRARRKRFLFILWKDIMVTALTMGGIILTQIGIFNQCACYTLWGRTGLALPENADVGKALFFRINTSYPAIAFVCVGFQLVVIPCLLLRQYVLAVRVFLQRDDEKSNLPGWMGAFWGWSMEAGKGAKARTRRARRWMRGGLGGRGENSPVVLYAQRPAGTELLTASLSSNKQYDEYAQVELDETRISEGTDRAGLERAYFPR